MSELETKINVIEKVIEQLHKDIKDLHEVVTMHIRSHMAEFEPIHIYNKVDISNGVSYTWGNYYRAPVNVKENINAQKSEIQSGEVV